MSKIEESSEHSGTISPEDRRKFLAVIFVCVAIITFQTIFGLS